MKQQVYEEALKRIRQRIAELPSNLEAVPGYGEPGVSTEVLLRMVGQLVLGLDDIEKTACEALGVKP